MCCNYNNIGDQFKFWRIPTARLSNIYKTIRLTRHDRPYLENLNNRIVIIKQRTR